MINTCDICHEYFSCQKKRKCDDNKYRCQICQQKRDNECKKKYEKSLKGKITRHKANTTENRKLYMREYKKQEKYLELSRKFCKKRYWQDPEGGRLRVKAYTHGVDKTILMEVIKKYPSCVFCGSKENLEFDHIYPVSLGGKSTLENFQRLCKSCNGFKDNHILLPKNTLMITNG